MSTKRLANIELLRLLSMALVVLSHYLIWGTTHCDPSSGVTFANGNLLNSISFPFLSSLSSLGVICYVLISGYFLCESNTLRISSVVKTWTPMFFYSVLFAAIGFFCHKVPGRELFKSFLPVRIDQYWFVTKYIALLLLAPFLSIAISSLSKKGHLYALIVLSLLTVTITHGFPYGNVVFKDNPLSLAPFILIFFIAAYLKKYDVPEWMENNCGKLFWFFILLQGAGGVAINLLRIKSEVLVGGFSSGYNALTIIPGVLLFMWFRKQSFKDSFLSRAIVSIAPYSFGVYLIHDHPFVRDFLWNGPLDMANYWTSPIWFIFAMLVPCIFVIVGCFIDFLRGKLFSAVGFNRLLSWVKKHDIEIR